MIIIRTQDRHDLLKTRNISVLKNRVNDNKFNIVDSETGTLLGIYSSKAQAIKIMDKMEQLILEGPYIKTIYTSSAKPIGVTYHEPHYQMPDDIEEKE